MHWVQVCGIADKLPVGNAFKFSEMDIKEAAESMLLSGFDYVRRSDIIDFIQQVESEFNVNFIECSLTSSWVMRKRSSEYTYWTFTEEGILDYNNFEIIQECITSSLIK